MKNLNWTIITATAMVSITIIAVTTMYIVSNRYTVVNGGDRAIHLVNNLTGEVKYIFASHLHDVKPTGD